MKKRQVVGKKIKNKSSEQVEQSEQSAKRKKRSSKKQSPSQIYVRRICNFLEVYASLVPYSPKEGAFILVAPSLETSCFPCRGPRVSTISFWISASMFWFFIRRSKTADLVWNLVYIILEQNRVYEEKKWKEKMFQVKIKDVPAKWNTAWIKHEGKEKVCYYFLVY